MKDINKEVDQQSWNKKRIILTTLMFLALMGVFGYALIKSKPELVKKPNFSTVEGINIQENTDVKKNVQEKINDLQKEAQSINLVEMASSSPQVQKVINDLKALEDYPKNQVKDACEKICDSF